MTLTTAKFAEKKEIKRFLYAEMDETERQAFEEKFLLDDDFFYQVSDTENELVDLYVKNKLSGAELIRFERSLEKLPARRQKTANAAALRTFIEEEKEIPAVVSAKPTFRQKLAELFTIKTPVLGYAISGLLVLFVFATIILLVQNGRRNQELAQFENKRQEYEQSAQIQSELQNEIANLRQSEAGLQQRIDAEREAGGDVTDELQRERKEREKLEHSLEKLKQNSNIKRPDEVPPTIPTIAAVTLKPGAENHDDGGANERRLNVSAAIRRIAVQLALPLETGADERFSVKLNEKIIAQNLKPRVAADGQKSLQLNILPIDVLDGENKLTVINAAGAEIVKYDLATLKK